MVAAGLYHHVFNRGNDRHPIFKREEDYHRYLRYLEIFSPTFNINIVAFTLMEWHIHLFLYDRKGEMSSFMHLLHGKYARLYNICHERTGHVFTDRFKNKIVDTNTYGKWLSRYIHRQAVDAGLVEKAEDYPWTSYHHYIGRTEMRFVSSDTILEQFSENKQEQVSLYRKFIEDEEAGPIDWRQTEINVNPIIGNREFIEKMTRKLGLYDKKSCEMQDVIEKICVDYGVNLDAMKYPSGNKERATRRYLIKMLNHNRGMSVSAIAKGLNISKGLVSMTLNNEEY